MNLQQIGELWMAHSGYDSYPPGGGPALQQWEAFKAGVSLASVKDTIKTAEINTLVKENRALIAERDYLNKKLSAISLENAEFHHKSTGFILGSQTRPVTVQVSFTNQELEDVFVALESYDWSQARKQRCRAIIIRIRPYLQRQVDEIRFSESSCKL